MLAYLYSLLYVPEDTAHWPECLQRKLWEKLTSNYREICEARFWERN